MSEVGRQLHFFHFFLKPPQATLFFLVKLFFGRWSDIYKARLDEKVRDLLQNSETTAVAEGSADAAATGAK